MNYPDPEAARRFLTALDPDPDPDALHCFQTFNDGPSRDGRLARCWHGTLTGELPKLKYLNDEGAGVFVTINKVVAGLPRLAENVTGVRAVYADADKPERAAAVAREIIKRGLRPSMVVQTSPGKFHFYWRTNDCPLDRFKPLQRGVAAALGTDPSVCDLPRVMRLPGFMHRKGEPFPVRLMGGTFKVYSLAEIERAYRPARGRRLRRDPASVSAIGVMAACPARRRLGCASCWITMGGFSHRASAPLSRRRGRATGTACCAPWSRAWSWPDGTTRTCASS